MLKHGPGTLIFENGSIYNGEWYEDKFEGLGHLLSVTGDTYEGDFMGNLKHGFGKEITPFSTYEG